MALAPGTRFGPYEIAAAIGVGGMGEVYRATDSRLGRDIAIKTLPGDLAQDPDRLARFEREAKLLASLNHAHIGAIYGLDEHAGTQYIAMELVEGQTLEERLRDGPLSIEDALRIALQIAEALEAAHGKGVVHRDLKPANIMLTRDSVVKVLDFGLAKSFAGDPDDASPAHSPALSIAMTQAGLIIGTAGYMSPEQASGQATDQRTDVWAFGVVLYEMLTGLPLFSGESVPHILADVLRSEPDWSRLPKNINPRLRLLLERCLEKKVRNRYHAIADARIEIEQILGDPHRGEVAPQAAMAIRRRALPVVAAAVVTAIVVGIVFATLRPVTPVDEAATQRLSIVLPANRPIATDSGSPYRLLALSADGTQLVYVTQLVDEPEARRLVLRSLDSLSTHDLPGTDDAKQPFFSPDGQWIGFFTSDGKLKKLSLAGGNPITLVDDINGAQWTFGAWSRDGSIIFARREAGLARVSAEGGDETRLTTVDREAGEDRYTNVALVPSGRAVLFSVQMQDLSGRIDAVMLDTGERRIVVDDAQHPLVLGDQRLLFQRADAILVAPFDAERLEITGPAVPLADAVDRDQLRTSFPTAQLAYSANGTLVYPPARDTRELFDLVARDGTHEPLSLPAGDYDYPRVSPDGQSLAYIENRAEQMELRIFDLQRGTSQRLIEQPGLLGLAWRPDGSSLAVSTRTDGIFLRDLNGSERTLVPIPAGSSFLRNFGWSPDGNQLAYTLQTLNLHDIWALTMGDGEPETAALISNAAREFGPRFSPDGRWLVFVSDESGQNEVVVARYPAGQRQQVSIDGGISPVWSPDGREVFFVGFGNGVPTMMSVAVSVDGDRLQLGEPEKLFVLRTQGPTGRNEVFSFGGNGGAAFDVLPDGERFVMLRSADPAGTRELVVVNNWTTELKRLVPTE